MDTEMEYVPMNIKQEVESASVIAETVNGSGAATTSNNNSSQATPDSVENKVSKMRDVENYLKIQKFHFLPLASRQK